MGLDAAHQPVADALAGEGVGQCRFPQGAEAVLGQHKIACLHQLQLGHGGPELVRVLLQPDNRQAQQSGPRHQSGGVGDQGVAPLDQTGQFALNIDDQQAGVRGGQHGYSPGSE